MHLLGVLSGQQSNYEEALRLLASVVDRAPKVPLVLLNYGNALLHVGRGADAIANYDKAIAIQPNYVDAWVNKGNALLAAGQNADAAASYEKALAINPQLFPVWSNRARAFTELKRFDDALESYQRALSLNANHAETWANKGGLLEHLRRRDEALVCYDRAVAINPQLFTIWYARGRIFHELERYDEAMACYQKTIALMPDHVGALHAAANLYSGRGDTAQAAAVLDRALSLAPDWLSARFARCTAELPSVYETESQIDLHRSNYHTQLKDLSKEVDRAAAIGPLDIDIEAQTPFFLAYQGRNDRELQHLYGSAICRIMSKHAPDASRLAFPPGSGERVRVGIVSGYFRSHSNWKIPINGWAAQLERERFELFGYHTGARQDGETELARTIFGRFVQGPLSLAAWRDTIVGDAPHVLIYPEIGMDHMAAKLAAHRLAPIQCNSWGHPDTSGYPTMDYFLSSDLMEPADGQQHYTERLVRLPNLSIYCEPVAAQTAFKISRQDLRLRPSATVFWCGQTLYKYLPQYDHVFARIASEVRDCQFVFVELPDKQAANELFKKRLNGAFSVLGLRSTEHCVFLPNAPFHQFVAAMGLSDIFLDSIGWSGCNSTLESLTHDLPIVTLRGALMRGRHTAAILTMMGVTETIAETIDDYIAAAVRLASDIPWRAAVKDKISHQKHRLYRDRECITALEAFLDQVARATSPP